MATSACQSEAERDPNEPDEQERLDALLRDEPLRSLLGPAAVAREVEPAGLSRAAARSGFVPDGSDPVGVWDFDDCSPLRTELDGQVFANDAFRAVGTRCSTGIDGSLGVAIAAVEDIIYVPDQPNFTFENGVTISGWFMPTAVNGTRTLFRKRDKGTSSFALLLNGGKFELVLGFGPGRAASVSSPARAKVGVFQQVTGTYDGATARLYVDGVEVNSFAVPGTIAAGPGPLVMGNDGSERRFDGTIDGPLFATHALTADQVLQLTCMSRPLSIVISPSEVPPVALDQPVELDVAVTNNNTATCPASTVFLNVFPETLSLTVNPRSGTIHGVPSGSTQHVTLTALASDGEPGSFATFSLVAFSTNSAGSELTQFSFELADLDPSGCKISTARELMITNTTVVDDPVRTRFAAGSTDPRNGMWTFKHLVEEMAPTPADAPDMIEAVFASIRDPQVINGFRVAGRSGMAGFLASWPRTGDGKLDLARAPLRLQAIVNRFDLRNLANGDAGEGRLVFAMEQGGSPLQATMIFEYKLPATTDSDVLGWAHAFHALGALRFGEDYNAALQAITERFVTRGARPSHPNGSAINAVRTNEIAFNVPWELREFHLLAGTGRLEPVPVELTPDRPGFDRSAALAGFINANQAAIIAERHTVPALLDGQPFQAGSIFNDLSTWIVPGVDPEARHHFALNTCNGCHSSAEANVGFLQIEPRSAGKEAVLSEFLIGTTVADPVTGASRNFNDLRRRSIDLKAIVCADPSARTLSGTTLRKGISRVH